MARRCNDRRQPCLIFNSITQMQFEILLLQFYANRMPRLAGSHKKWIAVTVARDVSGHSECEQIVYENCESEIFLRFGDEIDRWQRERKKWFQRLEWKANDNCHAIDWSLYACFMSSFEWLRYAAVRMNHTASISEIISIGEICVLSAATDWATTAKSISIR